MLSTISRRLPLFAALTGLLVGPYVSGAEDSVPSREELTYGSVTAVVTEIDRSARSVVLEFDDGRIEEYEIGDQIEDLAPIVVGDTLLAGFARSLAFELREPTAMELENPMEVVEEMNAPDSETGTGSAGRLIRAVTTVEALDRINMTATLKGPLGNYLTIDVENAELLTQVNIGQTVVATFTEAIVLSLSKTE